ncbi:hypothetical protein C0Q70_00225 [Pomacea canaliculata]|uniref:Uncharacterized protein n=1 Tax=Pomacea canaliculata TaxID=400727 RepID=A0A2T7PW38_POMCA|nr:hypothetical protein C0Q70_00225 [Pomacea canaliculata]
MPQKGSDVWNLCGAEQTPLAPCYDTRGDGQTPLTSSLTSRNASDYLAKPVLTKTQRRANVIIFSCRSFISDFLIFSREDDVLNLNASDVSIWDVNPRSLPASSDSLHPHVLHSPPLFSLPHTKAKLQPPKGPFSRTYPAAGADKHILQATPECRAQRCKHFLIFFSCRA